MKKIINGLVIMALLTSCGAMKQSTSKTPTPSAPVLSRADAIGVKWDSLLSKRMDSFYLSVKRIENGTFGSDTSSVDQEIDTALSQFQQDIRTDMEKFIAEWDSYVQDSSGSATASFKKIRISGIFIKNPRVKEILQESVKVGNVEKNFNDVLDGAITQGKFRFYFMRGTDSSFIFTSSIQSDAGYFDTLFLVYPLTVKNLDVSIQRDIQANQLSTIKVVSTNDRRTVYGASTAKEYWALFIAQRIRTYLAKATKVNVNRRHALQ